jgi:catalase
MPEKDAENYRFDVLDITKIWPHSDYPLIKVGKMTLNRNPENYHAEVEQIAFSPSHLVPGIEPSNDKMLQGRLFSYPDTQRHRLGKNYEQIPVNCPYRARVNALVRDGAASVNGNYGSTVNYEPNSVPGSAVEDPSKAWAKYPVSGEVGRYPHSHPNTYYEQPRTLWEKVFTETDREHLISNLSGPLSGARRDIQEGFLNHIFKIHPDYGTRLAKAIGVPMKKAKM